jgi:hypothetical protein
MNEPPITIHVDNEPVQVPSRPITVRELLILVGLDPECFFLIEVEGREQKSHRDRPHHQLHPHHHLRCVTSRIEAICPVS